MVIVHHDIFVQMYASPWLEYQGYTFTFSYIASRCIHVSWMNCDKKLQN